MLGKVGAMLTQDMIEESSFYQMVLEKGIEKGIETGRLEEAKRIVRRVQALRFPSLGNLPELDALDDPDQIEKLADVVATAEDPQAVRSAIQQAKLR